jgi:hypothetical protein
VIASEPVTADENAHRLAVTRIDATCIVGANKSVPIDRVTYVEKRQLKKVKPPVSFSPSFDGPAAIALLVAVSAYRGRAPILIAPPSLTS